MTGKPNTWTDHRLDTLAKLLAEGVSIRKTAVALGLTPGQVSGRIMRERWKAEGRPRKRPSRAWQAPDRPAQPLMQLSQEACRWPIGEPGQPGFAFCCSTAAQGKPYCPEHCAKAYRKDSHAAAQSAPR